MKGKEDLFLLIRSMSKSEKRYFTLDAQKSGRKGARYLELFHALNEMEDYEEGQLKKRFGKNLPFDKTYLYEAILRSMRDYRSINSFVARIKEMILDSKFLYERGLYEQAEERLDAAKKLAYELGDQLSIIELNKEQRRLWKDTKRKGYDVQITKLIEEKEENMVKLNEELRYLDIHDQLLVEIRKNPRVTETRQRESLKTRFTSLLKVLSEEPTSLQGQLRYNQCMALYFQLMGDADKVFDYFTRVMHCWDDRPKYKEEEFYRYVLDVSNLLHAAYTNSSKIHLLPELLSVLEKEQPTSPHDQQVLFQKIAVYKLIYHIHSGDFSGIDDILGPIDQWLKQYNFSPSGELVILFNAAVLLFMAERFDLCREWAERIITRPKTPQRQDIQHGIRIINLVATLQLEEVEEIEACLRSTQRYFNKINAEEARFYHEAIGWIRRIYGAALRELPQLLKEARHELASGQSEAPLGLDELLLYWLDSKIQKQSISRLIRSKTKENVGS